MKTTEKFNLEYYLDKIRENDTISSKSASSVAYADTNGEQIIPVGMAIMAIPNYADDATPYLPK